MSKAVQPTDSGGPMPNTGQETDLISVIVGDHRDVEPPFGDFERGMGQVEGREELTDHVVAELVRHSVAEEQCMYPAAGERLPDGDEIEEHADAAEIMKRLEGWAPTSPTRPRRTSFSAPVPGSSIRSATP